MLAELEELMLIGRNLGIDIKQLDEDKAKDYIDRVLRIFSPFKTTGHLGIGRNSIAIPLEKHEYTYMNYLEKEQIYIFFDQYTSEGKKTVINISDVNLLEIILKEAFGMEYFISNEKMSYLIAVNWYAIEVAGTAKDKLITLLE